MRKVILTCAVVGENKYNKAHPKFPVTPQEIANAALEAEAAGASCIHLHVRNPLTGDGSRDPNLFLDMFNKVMDNGCKSITNITCGCGAYFFPEPEDESRGGDGTDIASAEERTRHIEMCMPEMCSLDVCTQNQQNGDQAYVYLNTEYTLRKMAKIFQQLGVKPEIEVFAPGDILLANQMWKEGLFDDPPMFQIVTGTRWGLPSTVETLIYMRSLLPSNANWAAFGTGRMQMPMVAQSVLLGGNVRVGLEDNLYLSKGVFATNAELVTRARQIIENLGYEVATPNEARNILGLKIFN